MLRLISALTCRGSTRNVVLIVIKKTPIRSGQPLQLDHAARMMLMTCGFRCRGSVRLQSCSPQAEVEADLHSVADRPARSGA